MNPCGTELNFVEAEPKPSAGHSLWGLPASRINVPQPCLRNGQKHGFYRAGRGWGEVWKSAAHSDPRRLCVLQKDYGAKDSIMQFGESLRKGACRDGGEWISRYMAAVRSLLGCC